MLFALTDSPGKALLVLVVYIAVQQIESNVMIPLVMSRAVQLHPAVIAIGVVVVGQLFGIVGLFVAVPILVADRDRRGGVLGQADGGGRRERRRAESSCPTTWPPTRRPTTRAADQASF